MRKRMKPKPLYDFRWDRNAQAIYGPKKMAKFHANLTERGYVLRTTRAGTLIYEKFADPQEKRPDPKTR